MNDCFDIVIKPIIIGMVVFLCITAIVALLHLTDFFKEKEIDYYENGVKIPAIKYHNEIYLKKGE